MFVKINDRYKLNKNYLNFVDSVLQRIDYSIIFGDYEREYKELVKLKKRYINTKNEFYKTSIINLIENLYIKFYNRDREIQILLLRLENDISLDIDILLENAVDILEKVDELIVANEKIGLFFRKDLRDVDEDIDKLLQSIGVNILKYIQNIDRYIKDLNQFIIQTKKRRFQNKQIITLSNMIMDEDVNELEQYLILNPKRFHYTVTQSQKNRIKFFADDNDIQKFKKELKEILQNFSINKLLKKDTIKTQTKEKLDVVDVERIIKDLENLKSDDVFTFIKSHDELQRFENNNLIEESFKIYLHISVDERMIYDKSFNEFGVKVAKWQ